MHINPCGYRSKHNSIEYAAEKSNASIVTMNETGLTGNNKVAMKQYLSFNRNRKNGQKMGGISTLVREVWKPHTD